jgi:mannose-6-phosphate isomerase-like protein (cupin superfamily)
MANRPDHARALLVLLGSLLLSACGHGEAKPAARPPAATAAPQAMLDALFEDRRLTRPLADLAASAELAPGEAFRSVELGRDAHSSHHIVALRAREPLHRHEVHDLLVVVLKGHGSMRIGDEERAIGERSIVFVPRGAVHAMVNLSGEPLTGYAVFMPAFDGQDRVLVAPDVPAAP